MTAIESKSESPSIEEIAKNLNDAGIPPDFGDDNSRLLIKMWRTLGQGQPVTREITAQIADGLGLPFERADEFLRQITERDSNDNIIGLVGLSNAGSCRSTQMVVTTAVTRPGRPRR